MAERIGKQLSIAGFLGCGLAGFLMPGADMKEAVFRNTMSESYEVGKDVYKRQGMYSVTAGEMTFKGQDISTDTRKRPLSIKKDIGMVFQDPGTTLNPQRSVKQILSLPLSVHGMLDKKDPEGQLLQLLEDCLLYTSRCV